MRLFIVSAFVTFGVVGVLSHPNGRLGEGLLEGGIGEGLGGGGYYSKGTIVGLSRGIEVGRGHRGEEEERGGEEKGIGGGLELIGLGGGEEEGKERGGGGGEEKERRRESGIGWGGSHFITPVDVHHEEVIHLKARPEYHYDYRVADPHTKDYKSKQEVRDGYRVKGSYSLLEPDHKTVRVVDYVSDKKKGFIAKVSWRKHI